MTDFRKCLIAAGMRYVGGIRKFASFDQSNEKAFIFSVSGHRYLKLNLLNFRLMSEANLSIDIFPNVVLEYRLKAELCISCQRK